MHRETLTHAKSKDIHTLCPIQMTVALGYLYDNPSHEKKKKVMRTEEADVCLLCLQESIAEVDRQEAERGAAVTEAAFPASITPIAWTTPLPGKTSPKCMYIFPMPKRYFRLFFFSANFFENTRITRVYVSR